MAAEDPLPWAPWHELPSGGDEMLDEVRAFLRRFVAFPSPAAADAVTLWAAHSHVLDSFDSTPRLAFLSPEPGSGKTRTLEILELLVPRPMHVLSASTAAVFRSIADARPTLLLDEVDTVFARRGKDEQNEDLRGLLNAGHRRGATIPRCVGPNHTVSRFPVYSAVALAGLGDLPDTLMSRSVIVRMRRRGPTERVEPFRHRQHAPAGEKLRASLADWGRDVADLLADAWPQMPAGVEDRPADCWEALLAVADAAGGHWPATGRAACVELVKVAESREASLGVRLLSDLRTVFRDLDTMPTADILTGLHELPEAPWKELRGKPLADRGLARMLGNYGIASVAVWNGTKTLRGYKREHLHDTWTRYLPPLLPAQAQEAQEPQEARSEQGSLLADAEGQVQVRKGSARDCEPLTSGLAELAELADLRCEGCGEPMTPVEPGQTAHPNCLEALT